MGKNEDDRAVPSGLLKDSKYNCLSYLNKGAQGFVVLASHPEKKKMYALKFILKSTSASKYVEREIINQFKLKHPHIIKLEEIFLTHDHLVLVLEYADGGDLFSYVKSQGGLKEDSARWLFQQLILAVDFCHKMGVVNRDIKLENILLSGKDKKMVKLSDFGFSKDENRHSAPSTRIGTVMYIAPEVIESNDSKEYDARKSDVWSCGVVLYIMISCHYPFIQDKEDDPNSIKAMHKVVQRTLANDYIPLKNVSQECNELVRKMLEPDPLKRVTVQEVMQHPWFLNQLNTKVLSFNDQVVKQLTEHPRLTDEMIYDIRRILRGQEEIKVNPSMDLTRR
jgi:serine/threonine-protein kinase SRK2